MIRFSYSEILISPVFTFSTSLLWIPSLSSLFPSDLFAFFLAFLPPPISDSSEFRISRTKTPTHRPSDERGSWGGKRILHATTRRRRERKQQTVAREIPTSLRSPNPSHLPLRPPDLAADRPASMWPGPRVCDGAAGLRGVSGIRDAREEGGDPRWRRRRGRTWRTRPTAPRWCSGACRRRSRSRPSWTRSTRASPAGTTGRASAPAMPGQRLLRACGVPVAT